MDILIGKTGFVGGHLVRLHNFDLEIHRANLHQIRDAKCDLLVCAGLPAEKWRANANPETDWRNITELAQVLSTVHAKQAVLISTIDVYEAPYEVDERDSPSLNGPEAYGSNRAWFEMFFRAQFSESLILRLPALYAANVRKNLVHDLLHNKSEQWENMNPSSTFQFYDTTETWATIQSALQMKITLMNVTSEPVTAKQVAEIFDVSLDGQKTPTIYNVRSQFAEMFGGLNGYLFSQETVLSGIALLRAQSVQA